MTAKLLALSLLLGVAAWLAPAGDSPRCQDGECRPTACRTDLDCPKGCSCSQDMDPESEGVCVPPI